MEKSPVERYGLVIVLVVMVNAGMVWAQSHDAPAADGLVHEEMVAFIKDADVEYSPVPSHEYRDGIEMRRGVTTNRQQQTTPCENRRVSLSQL
jgi:hypothetical protein